MSLCWHSAKCHYTFKIMSLMLSDIMLHIVVIVSNVIMPSDHNVKMNVIMLHVVMPNVIQLSGTLLSVIILKK